MAVMALRLRQQISRLVKTICRRVEICGFLPRRLRPAPFFAGERGLRCTVGLAADFVADFSADLAVGGAFSGGKAGATVGDCCSTGFFMPQGVLLAKAMASRSNCLW